MPEIVISTDILGMFGKIADLNILYGTKFKKLELIGWNLTLDRHIKEAEEQGYEIASIHGQLVSAKSPEPFLTKIYMLLIDLLLKPTPKLVNYGKRFDLLFHAANINDHNRQIIINNKNLHQIWIENHYVGLEGTEHAMRIINELRSYGVNAGLTFDLTHFIGPANLVHKDFHVSWLKLLRFITTTLFKTQYPVRLHFPVGTVYEDALPIEDRLINTMLKDFANLIKDSPIKRLIIENKQKRIIDNFILHAKRMDKVKRRNAIILEKLTKAGII